MPESCWAIIMNMAMIRGLRRVELTNISFKVIFGINFMLSYKREKRQTCSRRTATSAQLDLMPD